ncbi:MAG: hypothetical protein KatS3mg031_0923 [Chitinophagales bacterium]|nr:MAG: hypothetical protein KatS3mg031_0923 [Chitinophagales bacterium]
MNHPQIIAQLESNIPVFEGLLAHASDEEVSWRPTEKKWCLLEIVCHLYDEEREDFRARLKHILEQPAEKLPPIDPVGWVTARKYAEQDYSQKVHAFLHERKASVRWLQSLSNPPWQNAFHHPRLGPLSAEMFLINWVAHDYLHIRQIVRTKYQYLKQTTAGISLAYAGRW